jgi:uncharacterized protein (TIRG00374 family)
MEHVSMALCGEREEGERAASREAESNGFRPSTAFVWCLGAAFSTALLLATFRGVDIGRVSGLLRGLGWVAPLLLAPSLLAVLLETYGWQLALRIVGQRTGLFALVGVRVASESIGSVLPLGAVWADALKPPLLLQRCDVPISAGVAAIAIRKYLLSLSQAAYLAIAFFAGGDVVARGFEKAAGIPALRFIALVAAGALFLVATSMAALLGRGTAFQSLLGRLGHTRWPALQKRLARLRQGAQGLDGAAAPFFRASFRVRVRPAIACLGGWLLEATETWLILRALGLSLGWGDAAGIEALVALSRHLLPFLPGGLGVQELGYTALLAGAGCEMDRALSLVVMKRAREAVWVALGVASLSGTKVRSAVQVAAVALVAAGCTERPPASPPDSKLESARALGARTVVLVAIDGVRWQDVFEGVDSVLAAQAGLQPAERLDAAQLVPNLHRLMTVDGAAVGAPGTDLPMRASGPNFVSLPGYMEMFTGRTDSGCTSNSCGDVPFSTIADDVARSGGVSVVIASWPGIAHAAAIDPEHVLMSIGRHGGANRQVFEADPAVGALLRAAETADPAPGEEDFRRDLDTGNIACAYLESRRPSFLFVGLGETDEYAHQNDYRGYLKALRDADGVIGRLSADVERLNAGGHPSTLMVTTDHGRASGFSSHGGEHPESARVWLVASGAGIRARGHAASDSQRRLSDVSQTLRRVLGLPRASEGAAGAVMGELFSRQERALASR